MPRFSMYNSLQDFISGHGYRGDILIISEGKEHSIRDMFADASNITATQYPETDIMDLSEYADQSFDFIISDQVLEHIPAPWTALEQIRKKLKIGGIAINTSCTFNPIHDEHDFYRFTPEGFRYLHETYIGHILLIDYWGNRKALSDFITLGSKSFDVRLNPADIAIASRKELLWPWVVWCIAKRVT